MMKKFILALVCLLAPLGARAQVAVTGSLKDAGVSSITGTNSFVRFTLTNFGNNIPKVAGSNVVGRPYFDFHPDANGNISGPLQGNDSITPNGTLYQVCIFDNGTQFKCNNYSITGNNFNLNTATPIVVGPTNSSGFIMSPKVIEFVQSSPSTTWTISHNFGDKNVLFDCYDTTNKFLIPDTVTQTSISTLTITYTSAQAGSCTVMTAQSVSLTNAPANAVVTNSQSAQVITTTPLTIQSPFNSTGGGSLVGTYTGPTATANLNATMYVGSVFSASDIGAQINAAYAALPSTGGRIIVTPQLLGGCYSYSTPIVLATQGKFVILEGGSGTSNAVGDVDGNTCLDYTPNTATVAMSLGWGPVGGGGYSPGAGLRDITLKANGGCFAVGGCGNLATGVVTTNGGVPQGFFQNVKIEGFATGWNYNDNSDGWGVQWIQVHLVNNTLGLLMSATLGEEKLFWDGGSCSVNATCMSILPPATDLYIHGVSIDSNTVLGINNGGTITCVSCHFENLSTLNAGGTANVQYINSGNAVTLIGGLVLNDNATGGPIGQFFTTSTGFFSMYGTAVYSPHQVMTSILNNTSAGSGNINVTTISPSEIPAICSAAQNCIGGVQIGSNPAFQIPTLMFPEGPSVTGLGNFTQCGANATSHILECNYDLSGTYQMTQTIASSLIQTPAVLGTSSLASGACASVVTVSTPGVNINDTLTWSYNGDPTSLSGYGANAAGHLDISAWPSANAVNFKVCNSTAGSLTPHSLQLNWSVVRW